MATAQEIYSSQIIPSFLESVSKLDSKRYSWSIKSDNGKINLEIVDKSEFRQSPTQKDNFSGGLDFSRGIDLPARGCEGEKLKPGNPNFSRRHLGVHTTRKVENFQTVTSDTKSKAKHKSPSERGRDSKRLQKFVSDRKPGTDDKTCQTSLDTSDKLNQASPEFCDSHSQTSRQQNQTCSNPPRLESSALKVAVNQCCLGSAYKIIGLQKDRIDLDRELVKNSAAGALAFVSDIKELKDKVEEQTIEIKKRDLLIQSRDLLIQQCQQASAVAELNAQLGSLAATTASIHQTEATTTVIQPPEVDPTVCWNPPCKVTGCTKKCTACSKAVYCGKNCQTAHWKQHKRDSCRK